MRIDPDTCRDPDLLAAEVRRLRTVIDSGGPCPYVTGNVTRYCTLTPFTLTDEEREAVRFALNHSGDWPLDGPQLAVVAHTLGPSCQVPEHRMKATLRGLLERCPKSS